MSLTTKEMTKFNKIAHNWTNGDDIEPTEARSKAIKQVRALTKLELLGLVFRSTEWTPYFEGRLPLDNFFLFIEDALSGRH